MKITGYLALGVLSFLVTVLAAMAFTGTLSKETFDKLLKRGETTQETPRVEVPDDLDPIVQALKARGDELDRRDAQLKQEADRLERARRDLEELRTDLETLSRQITASLDQADAAREQQLQDFASSLGTMRPENAARTLQELDPVVAATVMQLMEAKDRGKVLDQLDPKIAADLLRRLQEPKY